MLFIPICVSVVFSGCPNVDWPDWACLEGRLATRRPPLEYIDLTDCGNVTDAGLCALMHTCPSLQYLYLRRCILVTGTYLGRQRSPNFFCLVVTCQVFSYIRLYLFCECMLCVYTDICEQITRSLFCSKECPLEIGLIYI